MLTESPKRHLLHVAARLYREGGVAAVTTDALAHAAATSKRTIYQHFSSRDEILETLFLERLERLSGELRTIEESSLPIYTKILRFSELVAVVPQDFPAGFWPELQRSAPMVAERVRLRRKEMSAGVLHRLFTAGVESGDVREDIPIPLMIAVAETLSEHLLEAELPLGQRPLALAEAGIRILLEGILRRRGE